MIFKPFIHTVGRKKQKQMKEGICCRGAASALCHSAVEIKLSFVWTETGNQAKTKYPEFKFLELQLRVEEKEKEQQRGDEKQKMV